MEGLLIKVYSKLTVTNGSINAIIRVYYRNGVSGLGVGLGEGRLTD